MRLLTICVPKRFGGLGALGHRPFLRAQFLNGVLQGDGQQRGLPRVTQSMTRVPRRRHESQQRPGHHRDEHGDERGDAEQRVRLRVHW